ncbi:MAG TPA: hypothetical protein VFE53_06355 [Mucilaginibacter sp.]|jgi:hypothetical protein|nr:hypothetical protein [Mucilaginibacter sp.]
MSWYKYSSKNAAGLILGFVLLVCTPACKPHIENNGAFDLSGFIKKDAARLKKLNRPVVKTVYHNGVTETKTVHIDNWEQELGLFIDADINKPTWKSSYYVTSEDSLLVYRAKETDLKVRYLLINHDKQKVKWILIYTKTPKNHLYLTTQKLVYFPDSLYSIDMRQDVRFMKTNYYSVKGVISKN